MTSSVPPPSTPSTPSGHAPAAKISLELQNSPITFESEHKEPDKGVEIVHGGKSQIQATNKPLSFEISGRRLNTLGAKSEERSPLCGLAAARKIERLEDVTYPEGVRGPSRDLNRDRMDGKFRYDPDFLLQFMHICKEKPPHLPPLDILGIEPVDRATFALARGGSGRHRQPSSEMTPTARQNSVGLGIAQGFGGKPNSATGAFAMGQFSTRTNKLASEERYLLSTGAHSVSGSAAAMIQTPSQGGPGGHAMGSKRTRSRRRDKRTDTNKVTLSQQGDGSGFAPGVAPLEISANHCIATSTVRAPGPTETDSAELVDRRVRSLLNKLTMETFDSVSDQIIDWANKSQNEKDARTLIQVTGLVFEQGTNSAAWSKMYARLCRKMMVTISPEVQSEGMKNAGGKPIAGSQLFSKYLLNRCQEDFKRGWFAKETTATASAAKASDDQPMKVANEKKGGESELSSDEHYTAKAMRRGLGLITFIGELFKLQIMTERIVHECIKKLLNNVENPEEIETLCQLLKTVGQLLDVPKARAHMDVYFTRMKVLSKSPNVSSRLQFMLQDVIELRDRKWAARGTDIVPTTLSAVHESAAKIAEAQNFPRHAPMSRGGLRRRNERSADSGPGPDGWTTAGGSAIRAPPKAGDLSQFGKISKGAPMAMGYSNVGVDDE